MNKQELINSLSEEELSELLSNRRETERLDGERKRSAYETLRNETVESLCIKAIALQQQMINFKNNALSDIYTVQQLLMEYSKRHNNTQGNFTIESGDFRIVFRNAKLMKFDERAITGKSHILDFVEKRWIGDEDTKNFIITLLTEQSTGELNIRDVNKLIKMENRFNDENWVEGIKLLKESYKEVSTKSYIRFYKKDDLGEYNSIVLNFATL